MNRTIIWSLAVLGCVAICPDLPAQASVNGVRIYTEPQGLSFTVDGQTSINSVDLLWPVSSSHVIASYDQVQGGTRYTLLKATTNLSESDVNGKPITADAGLKWVKLAFDTAHALTLNLQDCPADVKTCPGGARIEIDDVLYDRRTTLYIRAGAAVHARAFPTNGYIFTGWSAVWDLGITTQYDITFPMRAPLTLTAYAQIANDLHADISIVTSPPEFQVLLDRTPYVAPITLQWGWGTVHAIGVEPVQYAKGVPYVFDSWSDGGAINHDVQVPSQLGSMSLVARYLPGINVGFATAPNGLSLSVDGRQSPVYDFVWAAGTSHKISAPALQTDAQGRKYRFVSWSNGQPGDWNFTTGSTPPSDRIRAVYQLLGTATIDTIPAGITLQVDGKPCDSPCRIEKDTGSPVKISAPVTIRTGDRSRLAFHGWNDSTQPDRTIVLGPDTTTYTAAYGGQNQLSIGANPVEGSTFTANPASPDGFYDVGSLVAVTARPAAGFRIAAWSGDVSGSGTAVALTLDSPKSAVLLLDRVPAIVPMGVRNAALGADPGSVAAGSLISIFGANLAPAFAIGPRNPLAQTLGSVTVRVNNLFLPLVFVSPGQINAQLPSATPEGSQKIVVRWEGKPETEAEVLVARNAPGLFSADVSGRAVGSFVRPNGDVVTASSPARAGETISVLGTGFGPCLSQPADGFIVDDCALIDPVSVMLNDVVVDALYAGRSGAAVGADAVRFKVPSNLPETPFVPLKIRVNAQESNTVLLPVSR